MTNEHYITLLLKFKNSLQDNDFTKLDMINQQIDELVNDLQNEKLAGIALPIRVQKFVYKLNDYIAFDGMKLNTIQEKYWNELRKHALAEQQADKRALDIFGSFIWH